MTFSNVFNLLVYIFPVFITADVLMVWYRSWRLYKHDFNQALYASFNAAHRSHPHMRLLLEILLISVINLCWVFIKTLPIYWSIFFMWSFLSVLFSTITWYIIPPGLLFLSNSKSIIFSLELKTISKPELKTSELNKAIRGYGVRYFLSSQYEYEGDDLITKNLVRLYRCLIGNRYSIGKSWKAIVYPLINIVPVILIDARNEFMDGAISRALMEEIKYIGLDPRLSEKSIILINPWQTQISEVHKVAPHILQTYSTQHLYQFIEMRFALLNQGVTH